MNYIQYFPHLPSAVRKAKFISLTIAAALGFVVVQPVHAETNCKQLTNGPLCVSSTWYGYKVSYNKLAGPRIYKALGLQHTISGHRGWKNYGYQSAGQYQSATWAGGQVGCGKGKMSVSGSGTYTTGWAC